MAQREVVAVRALFEIDWVVWFVWSERTEWLSGLTYQVNMAFRAFSFAVSLFYIFLDKRDKYLVVACYRRFGIQEQDWATLGTDYMGLGHELLYDSALYIDVMRNTEILTGSISLPIAAFRLTRLFSDCTPPCK